MMFRLRRWALVCCLVAASMSEEVSAFARDAPSGTKNFVPPAGVPNYFSNEAEPFLGRGGVPTEPGRRAVAAAPGVRSPARPVANRRAHYYQRGRAVHAKSRVRLVSQRHHHAIHNVRVRRRATHAVRHRRAASPHYSAARRLAAQRPAAPHGRGRVIAQR